MRKCPVCDAISSAKAILFEDEDIMAYLPEDATCVAHAIVATKRHFPSIFEAPDYLVAWAFAIANKLSKVVIESLSVQGLNTLVQAGHGGEHFVIHIIPRFENDGLKLKWNPAKGDTEELRKIQGQFNSATSGKWIFEKRGMLQEEKKEKSDVLKETPGEENYLLKHLHRLP